jgi:chromate transporter
VQNLRHLVFLKDILLLAFTAFGGPQAHIALFLKQLVNKRRYLTEEKLLEINGLCQMLPGPSSTQTLIAISYQRGGVLLALLALLIWLLPATCAMTFFALSTDFISPKFARFVPYMAVGFVVAAAIQVIPKILNTKMAWFLTITTAVVSCTVRSPWELPFIVFLSGVIASFKFYKQEKKQAEGDKFDIRWRYFLLYAGIFVGIAVLGGLTRSLPIRLFENFYRNGSLIFGGGQVLVPVLYTEFVAFKQYLTAQEFAYGFATVQALPGPVFSFSAYIGALSMREFGIWGSILGGFIAALAINLPGALLIFFFIPFWESLKKYRAVRASLEGINAAGAGLVISAAYLLFVPLKINFLDLQVLDLLHLAIILLTFLLLKFTKIPHPFIVIVGIIAGFWLG